MPLQFKLLIVFCLATVTSYTQKFPPVSVTIGDAAPAINLHDWMKGAPVKNFGKGKIYVLEFWATWCRPCRTEMPILSDLARKYRESVTVIGVDVFDTMVPLKKIKAFVDSMGLQWTTA